MVLALEICIVHVFQSSITLNGHLYSSLLIRIIKSRVTAVISIE